MKVTDKNFSDWESSAFGYGYGTGEEYIIPKLKQFIEALPNEGSYHYERLEELLGPESTWFLINVLCKEDIITYGTSPRYGWLTEKGDYLREYMSNKTLAEIYKAMEENDDCDGSYACYKDHCNCDEVKCVNPLWGQSSKSNSSKSSKSS